MARKKELRIYCVTTGETYHENYQEVNDLSDEEFISRAEEDGTVYTLKSFLYSLSSEEMRGDIPCWCLFRAYLIDLFNPNGTPIRVDNEDTGFLLECTFRIDEVK